MWVLEDDVAFTGNAAAWFDAQARSVDADLVSVFQPFQHECRRLDEARPLAEMGRRADELLRRPCEPPEGSPRDAMGGDSRALWPVHKREHIERLSPRLLGALRSGARPRRHGARRDFRQLALRRPRLVHQRRPPRVGRDPLHQPVDVGRRQDGAHLAPLQQLALAVAARRLLDGAPLRRRADRRHARRRRDAERDAAGRRVRAALGAAAPRPPPGRLVPRLRRVGLRLAAAPRPGHHRERAPGVRAHLRRPPVAPRLPVRRDRGRERRGSPPTSGAAAEATAAAVLEAIDREGGAEKRGA